MWKNSISNMIQKCQKMFLITYFRWLPFRWGHCGLRCANLLIMRVYSSCVIIWIFSVMATFNAAIVRRLMLSLRNLPEEEIWLEVLIRWVRCSFHISFAADETLPKLFINSCHVNNYSERKSLILLKPLLLLIKVITLLKVSLKQFKYWNITVFCYCQCVLQSSSRKNTPMVICFEMANLAVLFFNTEGFYRLC